MRPVNVIGSLDMATISIERNLDEAVSGDGQRVRAALSVLEAASAAGRAVASVFLLGFLVSLEEDDWEMRGEAVRALRFTPTRRCADLLFAELRRVKSNNTTWRYLDRIIDVLRHFPEEIVGAEFDRLAEDRSFSPRMRKKFQRDQDMW